MQAVKYREGQAKTLPYASELKVGQVGEDTVGNLFLRTYDAIVQLKQPELNVVYIGYH